MKAYRDGPMAAADRTYNAIRDRWPLRHDFDAGPEAHTALRAAFDAHAAWEHRLNDPECAHFAAIKRLVGTPAPNLDALATKIELVVDYEVGELDGGDRCMAALKADARRLATTPSSRRCN
jgi:hypothetical protein